MSGGPILAIPARERGRGGGHLIRCLALVRDLRALGREAWLLCPENAGDLRGVFDAAGFDPSWLLPETGVQHKSWDCIILDRFQTPPDEMSRWAGLAPLIGIDEGGPCRDRFDFLIDILPGCYGRSKPNIADPSLLPLPERKQEAREREAGNALKVLVSFGQEDAAGLGPAVAAALAAKNSAGLLDITLLAGGLRRNSVPPVSGVNACETIPKLAGHLAEYDLLITHYGLTAFEALYAGTPVLLAAPSAYHEKLAKAAGFCSVGTGPGKGAKIARLLFRGTALNRTFLEGLKKISVDLAVRHRLDRKPEQSLAALIAGFTIQSGGNCPVCGALLAGRPFFGRGPERSFRRCPACGVIAMSRLTPPPIEYEKEYFFDFYRKQYGKTYIEDFPHLTALGKRRLSQIKALLPAISGRPLLLDIGCAYGPFLAAAREEGFSPAGIDPAEDAERYVTEILGIPAARAFFPDCLIPVPEGASGAETSRLFDVVSLWYVIEHFRDCVPVFAAIKDILKPGGILAFSSPSFSGVSGRFFPARFLSQSPADHWTIWSPVMCKKALARAGFRVKKIVISGCHPERFPVLGKFAQNKKSPLYRVLSAASAVFGLGDTFEVYASAVY